jgi:hypothetical protein
MAARWTQSARAGIANTHKHLFCRLLMPEKQRVELTGPETGRANEANCSGPAMGRIPRFTKEGNRARKRG